MEARRSEARRSEALAELRNDSSSWRFRRRGDRFHSRALKTPREVKNALVYVLANFRKHERRSRRPAPYRESRNVAVAAMLVGVDVTIDDRSPVRTSLGDNPT